MGNGEMRPSLAYLGMGTNLGDRCNNLLGAATLLANDRSVRVLRRSRIYETEPWGMQDQPPFLNCVAEVATTLDPEELLTRCKEVEYQLGRVPGPRWGPRAIDLDILLFGTEIVDLPHLQVPHPHLHLRAFALIPLAELAPTLIHPSLERTIGDLAATVEGTEGVREWGEQG